MFPQGSQAPSCLPEETAVSVLQLQGSVTGGNPVMEQEAALIETSGGCQWLEGLPPSGLHFPS